MMATAENSAIEPDSASQLLVAESILSDIALVQATRKGKAREDTPLNDEEIAFNLQAASLNAFIGVLQDHQFASSVDRALELDAPQLRRLAVLDRAERDDHLAAVALENGRDLPRQTTSQQMMGQITARTTRQPFARPGLGASSAAKPDMKSIEQDMKNVHINTGTVPPNVNAPQPSKTTQKRPQCVICMDDIVPSRALGAPCAHYHCKDCIVHLVETSLRDEGLYPLRCCQEPLPLTSGVFKFIPIELRLRFLAKSREYSVPAGSRVYCSNPRCSAFLGAGSNENLACAHCDTITCVRCKDNAHPGEGCAAHQWTDALRKTAAAHKWQTCPGCHAVIELSHGCYHITCRCSTQFCYLCAARWKTCRCKQWDDAMLLDDAERRVRNEFGHRVAEAQPEMHAERVHRRMEALREDHACRAHAWIYRHGAGACEECGDTLRIFLMRCVHCQALVCRRCSVNRL